MVQAGAFQIVYSHTIKFENVLCENNISKGTVGAIQFYTV